jgi:hypothetical protein
LLGPDIVYDPHDPNHTSLAAKLSQALANALDDREMVSSIDNLAHVAQLFQIEKRDRMDLEFAVEDFYRDYEDQTTEAHLKLAQLPFSLCIDITHVAFMEKAYEQVGNSPLRDFYSFRKPKPPSPIKGTPERPLIYKLFGSPEEPDSLVITENDLLDFLVNVSKSAPPLPSDLTSRLRNPQTSFLFLGFGFHNWHFRILLHALKAENERRNISMALEDIAFFDHPYQQQTMLFYDKEHRLEFYHASWLEFAVDLSQRFQAEEQKRRPDTGQPSASMMSLPTVFLCHCSEDADDVEAIGAMLQQSGVNIWLDRQHLRGGDRWDQIIPKVIGEQVNYFVVLETPAMQGRTESYFYREINAALKRQEGFRLGMKFIFPVQLFPCQPLIELLDFQRTDLTQPDGLRHLVEAILDDWRRRPSGSQ